METDLFAEFASRVVSRLPRDLEPNVVQGWIDDPSSLSRVLRNALAPEKNGGKIMPPPGGNIHIVSVLVDESRPWNEAVRAAGPNTPTDSDVWKVGDQYPVKAKALAKNQDVILVNFGKHVSSEHALKWGKEQKLVPAISRVCFAVGEQHSKLNDQLAMPYMAVVSLVTCSFGGTQRVTRVWFNETGRGAYLGWFGIDWNDYDWFAFVRE